MAKRKKAKGALVVWGRPRTHDDAEEFKSLCLGYFVNIKKKAPNIAGICVYLGISRETWYDHKKRRKDLRETITNVELTIESWWVDRLKYPGAGSIFYLKNFRPTEFKERGAGSDPDEPLHVKHITGVVIKRG